MDENTTNPTPTPAAPSPASPTPASSSTSATPLGGPEHSTPNLGASMPDHNDPMKEHGSGAIVWVLVSIIVLAVLGAAGYYIWSSNQATDIVTTPAPTVTSTPVVEKAPVASDAATAALNQMSTADDTASIKKDLDNTNLSNLDQETADLTQQVQ